MPADLEIDLSSLPPRERYELLNSAVVPRPIAWICTVDEHAIPNLAPFSYFNLCSLTPPIVHFTATTSVNSISNVRATGEFVVNVVSEELLDAMHLSSTSFTEAGLTPARSTFVQPPRIAQSKVSLECRLHEIVEMGEGTMVFGEVLCAHVQPQIWRAGTIDPEALLPIGRMGGPHYARYQASTLGRFLP